MKNLPQELIDIILEELLEINPYLCAKVSKYLYYKAMPKIWGTVDLNLKRKELYQSEMPEQLAFFAKNRAWSFYNIYINPKQDTKEAYSGRTIMNANCLKFITKLEPYYYYYPGCVVNILKKCPNINTLDFQRFHYQIPYNSIVKFCIPNLRRLYINDNHHALPEFYLDGVTLHR
jgi:hypothetical protein